MDRFIQELPAETDGDLALCPSSGVAYQLDMRADRVPYDGAYFDKCAGYQDQAIAKAINAGRVALVNKYCGTARVLDVGIGCGEFIRNRPNTFGVDVNPRAIEWLRERNLFEPDLALFWAFTFWDVLEHVEDPEADYFRHMSRGAMVFVSLPIFEDLRRIRESRHYRPGEHLYYWTLPGFTDWMAMHGFQLLRRQTFEMDAGRDSIHTFAFKRTR